MDALKQKLLLQQKLTQDLNSLILSSEFTSMSNGEKTEIEDLNNSIISNNINNIDALKKRAIKVLQSGDLLPIDRKNLINILDRINAMEANFEGLQKQITYYETRDINNRVEQQTVNNINNQRVQAVYNNNNNSQVEINRGVELKGKPIKENPLLKKIEKNIGFYLINFIGLILLILGISTFGKHIYTNYMTDLTKGIFLFLISIGILLIGEVVLRRKHPKFSEGISALGICSLYMSTFINYLFLDNINELTALAISLAISILGIFISNKKKSVIIRILSLIGGFIALLPMNIEAYKDGYTLIPSVMVTVFILALNGLNIYKPVKDKYNITDIASVGINILFMMVSFIFIDKMVMPVLVIMNILYIYYRFKDVEMNDTNKILYYTLIILLSFASMNLGVRSIAVLIVLCALAYFTKPRTPYLISSAILINNLLIVHFNQDIITPLVLGVIAIFISYADNKKSNIFLKVVFFIQMFVLMIVLQYNDVSNLFTLILTATVYGAALFMALSQKDSIMYKTLKWFNILNLCYCSTNIFWKYIMLDFVSYKILLIIPIVILLSAIFIFTNFNLRDKHVEVDNLILLIGSISLSVLQMFSYDGYSIVGSILVLGAMYLFMNDEYLQPNKQLANIRNITMVLFIATNILFSNAVIDNIFVLILLMLVAIASITLGFKIRDVGLRRTGIGITIFTTVKLLVIDMMYMSMITRTISFIVIGILALVVSYIYSEIDKKYKNLDYTDEFED